MNSCENGNIGTKLRGSKSSEERGAERRDQDVTEDILGNYDVGEVRIPRGTLVICQRNTNSYSSDHSLSRFKPRPTGGARNEFRMARGGGSGDRGRGGSTRGRSFKKTTSDRDSNVESGYNPTSRSKFQESLKNQENLQNKYYDDKRISEDSRISKLLRRLCREDDYDHFSSLCKQLQESIVASENQRYIKRNLDIICENLFDILYSGPGIDAKQQVAKCLGRIGYVADQDFKRFLEWLFNKYNLERKDDIRCLLIKAFIETLRLDAEEPKLKDFSLVMMSQLRTVLENVERADLFTATVEAILFIIESYPESFSEHFRDTVDILIGWCIDSTQRYSTITCARHTLQRLRSFWIADLQFTLTLLGQFLEDTENCDEELTIPESGRCSPGEHATLPCSQECISRITSLISVFCTVTTCISDHLNPMTTSIVQWSFLSDCLSKMLQTVVKVIEVDDSSDEPQYSYLGQENVEAIIGNMKDMNLSQKYIDSFLKNLNKSNDVKEESIVKLIKSLNINKKNDKKNLNVFNDKDNITKEKEESLITMLKSMDLNIKKKSDLSIKKEDLIGVANQCASLLIGHLRSRASKNHDLLYKFITLQLQRANFFVDVTIISMLTTISKVIKEVSANLPIELVRTLLGQNSPLLELRFRNSITIQNAVLGVYQSLLSLKNIPLLQEAYRYVLADLEIAYRMVLHNSEALVIDNPLSNLPYHQGNIDYVLVFLLRALSDIANASNSIIGMWALKPTILELLAVKLKPHEELLTVQNPMLQYNILFLLYSHCSRYNHFVPSSNLITGSNPCRPLDIFPGTLEVPTVSPTSGHLSIILNLVAKIMENKSTGEQTILLLSDWLLEICAQVENYMGLLSKTDEYQNVISSLLRCGASTNRRVASAVCRNFEALLNMKQLLLPEQTYNKIVDLAILHLTSSYKMVRDSYGRLLINVPINIVLPKLNRADLLSENKFQGTEEYTSESLILLQRLHMRGNSGDMLAHQFKTYMAFVLQEYTVNTGGFGGDVSLCNPVIFESEGVAHLNELAVANWSFVSFWAGFEAAQHCVLNKLRTSLGKPQETFTTIEGALKMLAREISYNAPSPKKSKRSVDSMLLEHTRVRLLVDFLEHLERVIHNAAEGCAMALMPLSKPVRTFFHTNRSTCKEWLNRIRLALCVVSLHAGMATNALRNGQKLLDDLCSMSNTQGAEVERAALCVSQALVALGETEALQGLYVYTKEKDRKFPWLKSAMEEAAGKYEAAAESYRSILEEQILTKISDSEANVPVAAFCMERVTRCYMSLCDWKELEEWKVREAEILSMESMAQLKKQIRSNITLQQATCLKKFEDGEALAFSELSGWELFDQEDKGNWSCAKTMTECSNTLMNVALKIQTNEANECFEDEIKKCKMVAARTMEEDLRNMPSQYLSESVIMQYSAAGLLNCLAPTNGRENVFELYEADKNTNMNSNGLNQVLWWSDYFSKANENIKSVETNSLRLHVARAARKEGNFGLARREVEKYFRCDENHAISGFRFPDIVDNILNNGAGQIEWTSNNRRAFREIAKLLYCMDKGEEALKISSVTALGISQSIVNKAEEVTPELRETGTKVLLTVAKWIQLDAKISDCPQMEALMAFESLHNDGLMDKLFGKTTEQIPPADVMVGKLIGLGLNQCPDLADAWSNFAAWCYKWGRKVVDNSMSGLLTETDRTAIQELMPKDTPEADLIAVYGILNQKNRAVPEDEGDIEPSDANTSETIENLLRSVPMLNHATPDYLGMFVSIWRQAQSRIYAYYELSAKAYFKYLELAKDANNSDTITATLRLLRLVVKHASELQHVLEGGLSTTPTGPWKEIIPQLFSRLSHPESYVRTRVSELLCRVAENSPHLIIFPTVVGLVTGKMSNFNDSLLYSYSDSPPSDMNYYSTDENVIQDEVNEGFIEACFIKLAECLSDRIPDSVYQVKVLVKELRRITLLWDELWLATLCQYHSDIVKRFEQLEVEVQKVQDNAWLTTEEKERLITEKHRIILKPIIFILENLHSITSAQPQTPHEKNFQEKFQPTILKVIQSLKNPQNSGKQPATGVSLKQLEAKLAQRVNKRSAYSLQMSNISPTLAKFKDTSIAMPGICTSAGNQMITIRSVVDNIQILPTKTKPKKLVFRGSDGHVYTYLFKGLEDLHLDERIMQFLSICNTMMSKKDENKIKNVYKARHYSVIPLGPRSGLIQWVDGMTPLFALYKRWQQRESTVANKTNNSAILRPSELFYSKLTPLLKERGINVANRKEWPLPVLKQVLAELTAETPKDLLAKEIWCSSINAGCWWQATKNYSYSVAVMSIIGYIIGLGDRHLDNVLVDLNTGEVVHIDYNVCFEKGKTLRVPEKVPFRMTQNIKTALGVTGVEGIFRLACEHTLRVMRRGRETLLTLLEAFVYDPLVDWRSGAENSIAAYGVCKARARCASAERKQLELELTEAMLTVRTKEMRAEWLANRDDLEKTFPLLCLRITRWIEASEASRSCQESLQDRHRQLALVKEAQAMGRNHSLFTVVKRYGTFKRAKDTLENAKVGLKEKIEECQKQIRMHNNAFVAIRSSQMGVWLAELENPSHRDIHMVFDLVKEFLQNAGQSQMIVQCEQSETELTQLASQQLLLTRNCLDLLSQYSAICNLYPLSVMAKHRSVLYHAWSEKLLTSGTVVSCKEVLTEYETTLSPLTINHPQAQQIVMFFYQLQTTFNDANEKLKKNFERLMAEGLPETNSRLQIENEYTHTKGMISAFLVRENGGHKALECVIITALCVLNKRYLMMEGAAKCAGDCLVDLTSREGDWFLDEMRMMSSLVAELITLIPEFHLSTTDLTIPVVLKCLKKADAIYKGLQELNYNFHTIILPEASKTIITEDPTVMRMIAELDDIVASTGMPLPEMLTQLEMHMRFTVMEMDSPHALVQGIVSGMRARFDSLLSTATAEQQELNQEEALTPGQMLLMGFNGLFEKLQMEGNALVTTLTSLNIPPAWKKIDQIREAKEMSAPIFNEAARRVLDDIFLVKRLGTIHEFFTLCRSVAPAFRGEVVNFLDDDTLSKPIRVFIADYVSRQLLGVTTQTLAISLCLLLQRMGLNVTMEIEQRDIGAENKVSLEELIGKTVEQSIKLGLFNSSALTQASSLSSGLENNWRKRQSARLVEQSVEIARATVQRVQLQLTAYYWLNEDLLQMTPNLNLMNILNRPTFMMDLRVTASRLSALQARVCEAREQQQNLVASAVQRLKWASGANPALNEIMSAFDNAVLNSSEKLTEQNNLASIVVTTCNSILHYEALRTRTSESSSNDTSFLKLVKRWEDSCLTTANLTISVTPTEESLVELLQLEGSVDTNWLRQAEKVIADSIIETQQRLQENQDEIVTSQQQLREQVSHLQGIIVEHHRLMNDVRVVLRTLAKDNSPGLQEFLANYRSCTESLSAAIKELESDSLDLGRATGIKEDLEALSVKAPALYDKLLAFGENRSLMKIDGNLGKSRLMRQDGASLSPRKGIPPARDPTTGKALQERNAYALNVWRRVRMKLEGRDTNSSRKYTTAEQVEYVIREAQSADNLALLYEGWTPWV